MTVHTHPNGQIAADIYDAVRRVRNAVEAQRFMFAAHDELGGRSPLQAIKDGDADSVRAIVRQLKKGKP
jgi:hypothetical protein